MDDKAAKFCCEKGHNASQIYNHFLYTRHVRSLKSLAFFYLLRCDKTNKFSCRANLVYKKLTLFFAWKNFKSFKIKSKKFIHFFVVVGVVMGTKVVRTFVVIRTVVSFED